MRHPYLQPYVDQYRVSSDIVACSPEKPISTVRNGQKHMTESQNSSLSSSDKDSLHSNERNTSGSALNSDHKGTDTDMTLTDDGVECDNSCVQLPVADENLPNGEHGNDVFAVGTDELDVTRSVCDHQKPTIEPKQPKIKSILMALREEGRARENSSPVRGTRVKSGGLCSQKANAEASPKMPKHNNIVPSTTKHNADTPAVIPAKPNGDLVKRMPGSHPMKHLVRINWTLLF